MLRGLGRMGGMGKLPACSGTGQATIVSSEAQDTRGVTPPSLPAHCHLCLCSDDASLDGAATPPGPPSPGTPHADTGGLSAGTQAGIAVGATAGAVLLAALLYGCCRRKRGAARAGGAGAPDLGEIHEPYGASAKLSIIPGVKERFDLTEVVEASGGSLGRDAWVHVTLKGSLRLRCMRAVP